MKKSVGPLICAAAMLLPVKPRADHPPPSAFVQGVVGHPQQHNLSCEARSATDLAALWGAVFSEDDFFHRLPKSDNPHRGFLGDVDLPPGSMPPLGYGVYAGPVAATLRSFGLDARAHQEWRIDDLRAYLADGHPIIVWATYDMRLPGVQTWESSDGETSSIVKWQHTFIAVGYDEEGVHLLDAFDAQTKRFPYEEFLPAWEQLGRQAVTVEGPLLKTGARTWQTVGADGHTILVADGRWVVGPE